MANIRQRQLLEFKIMKNKNIEKRNLKREI